MSGDIKGVKSSFTIIDDPLFMEIKESNMGIENIEHLKPFGNVIKDGKRDKSLNTTEFNKKAKARRAKAKAASKSRKTNRRR